MQIARLMLDKIIQEGITMNYALIALVLSCFGSCSAFEDLGALETRQYLAKQHFQDFSFYRENADAYFSKHYINQVVSAQKRKHKINDIKNLEKKIVAARIKARGPGEFFDQLRLDDGDITLEEYTQRRQQAITNYDQIACKLCKKKYKYMRNQFKPTGNFSRIVFE